MLFLFCMNDKKRKNLVKEECIMLRMRVPKLEKSISESKIYEIALSRRG